MDTRPILTLKPGREKPVLLRHPWLFASGIDRLSSPPAPGETIQVNSSRGECLGWAAFSPASQIRARFWSFSPTDVIDRAFLHSRLQRAIQLRQRTIPPTETDAVRLVHAESDGLPGLIVDRYGSTLVMQCLSAGIEYWKETLADLLLECTGLSDILERSDADVRSLEGLPERIGPLRGQPAEQVTITENGIKYKVDLVKGHKTGFYLDQRPNRACLGQYAADKEILNCFSFTGGFTLSALAHQAKSVISIDSSGDALALAQENLILNQLPAEKAEWIEGDVFQLLRTYRDQNRRFDLIVLDPPKFAPTVAQAERASRGYKDINLLAFKLLRPGGLLFTFSCSGGISADLFQKIVAGAALDAGVDARIIAHLGQGSDHPTALNFPEGTYLKGLICAI
ncbi:MAG TPA: class I SAM-dependent methyltransferase [Anaerolineaceae bacterium]|nr:class I SAM-dependent methyltransferase [Anaerolineaceae bacterium]HPN51154.1 class I SAM-dependent methyltransferase [Anaerolineaceae bacterium]